MLKHLRGGYLPFLRSVDGMGTSAPQYTVTGIAGNHLALLQNNSIASVF